MFNICKIICYYIMLFVCLAKASPCDIIIDNVVLRGNCKGVLKHGRFIGYYDNGMPAWEIRYKYNVLNGKFRHFYPNGNLHFEGSYKDGILDGKFLQYGYNDKILHARFKKGVLHGWLDIFKDDKKIESMKFYYGKPYKRLFLQ